MIELARTIYRPRINTVHPRCEGLKILSSKKNNVYTDFQTFMNYVAQEIEIKVGCSPFEGTKCRKRELVVARQLFMVLLEKYTNKTLAHIGGLLGKDHATVLHAKKTIKDLVDTDKSFRVMYSELDKKVESLSLKLKK